MPTDGRDLANRLYHKSPGATRLLDGMQVQGDRVYVRTPDGKSWNFMSLEAAEQLARETRKRK